MTAPGVGTTQGDKLLAQGRNDPNLEISLLKKQIAALEKEQEDGDANEDEKAITKGALKTEMYMKQGLYARDKEEQMVGEFERNQTSLRLKPLALKEEPKEENDVLLCKAYLKDANLYKDETK